MVGRFTTVPQLVNSQITNPALPSVLFAPFLITLHQHHRRRCVRHRVGARDVLSIIVIGDPDGRPRNAGDCASRLQPAKSRCRGEGSRAAVICRCQAHHKRPPVVRCKSNGANPGDQSDREHICLFSSSPSCIRAPIAEVDEMRHCW